MSSSTKPSAFSFNDEFAPDGSVIRDSSKEYKRYRQDEVDVMCAEARLEGIASVEAETERRIAASVDAIVQHLAPVLPFAMSLADNARSEAAQLAYHIARKLAGAALDSYPAEAIEACISEALISLPRGAEIHLNVHPDIAERFGESLRPRLPVGCSLILQPDTSAQPGSWSLNWGSGGFSHDPADLEERIEALIENLLSQPLEPQGDLFAGVA